VKLIVVVGSGSGCGKTTAACRILRGIPGLGAVKISPRDEPLRVERGPKAPGKDTDLLAAAGASPVARIVGPRGQVAQAWEKIREEFQGCRGVLIEGTRGLDIPAPRFVIFVGGERWRESRHRRNTELAAKADVVVERSGPSGGEDLLERVRGFLAADGRGGA
jgi:hypothetical protein